MIITTKHSKKTKNYFYFRVLSCFSWSTIAFRGNQVSISIRLAAVQASGGACMKLHEIQCHFREIPHAVAEYGLRPRRRPRPSSPIKF
jgi:hypothetical protein